jgi:hypothetical protein
MAAIRSNQRQAPSDGLGGTFQRLEIAGRVGQQQPGQAFSGIVAVALGQQAGDVGLS